MKYDDCAKKIGERIKEQRLVAGLNRKEFLPKIYMSPSSYKTLAKWESGEKVPDLESLVRMSDLFGCDIGYLLGDYDEKHHSTADVSKQTGLSGNAVEKISDMNRFSAIPVEVLSRIILQPDALELFHKVFELSQLRSANKQVKDMRKGFELNHSHAKRMMSENAIEDVTYKEKAKKAVILELFDNILNGVIDEFMRTPDVFEQGRKIAQRALNPDEELAFRKWVFKEIDKMISEEEQKNG